MFRPPSGCERSARRDRAGVPSRVQSGLHSQTAIRELLLPSCRVTMTVATVQRRYCVVTPYYKEERALLERCFGSVRRQVPNVDHIVVADGHPQDWIDALPVRHIKLDRAHGDYGNAARGLGALMAIAEGYDGIAFLDADNWYDDDHLASCLAAAESGQDISHRCGAAPLLPPRRVRHRGNAGRRAPFRACGHELLPVPARQLRPSAPLVHHPARAVGLRRPALRQDPACREPADRHRRPPHGELSLHVGIHLPADGRDAAPRLQADHPLARRPGVDPCAIAGRSPASRRHDRAHGRADRSRERVRSGAAAPGHPSLPRFPSASLRARPGPVARADPYRGRDPRHDPCRPACAARRRMSRPTGASSSMPSTPRPTSPQRPG